MSKTISYVVINLLNNAFSWAGLDVVPGDVDGFINVLVNIVTLAGIAYERYKRGDITIFGKKI